MFSNSSICPAVFVEKIILLFINSKKITACVSKPESIILWQIVKGKPICVMFALDKVDEL